MKYELENRNNRNFVVVTKGNNTVSFPLYELGEHVERLASVYNKKGNIETLGGIIYRVLDELEITQGCNTILIPKDKILHHIKSLISLIDNGCNGKLCKNCAYKDRLDLCELYRSINFKED